MQKSTFSVIDLLACAAIACVLATIALAADRVVSEDERRVSCARNLGQLGQAMLLYANENRNHYPRTRHDPANPAPVWATPYEGNPTLGPTKGADPLADGAAAPAPQTWPAPNDVTAAMFLLVRTQDVSHDAFVCPSSVSQTKWVPAGGSVLPWTNWPGVAALRAHVSYSMQNPYADREAHAAGFRFMPTLDRGFVVMADMNPGTDAVLALLANAAPEAMRGGNSANHNGDGQNVLTADGAVKFVTTPFAGVARDHIYTYGPTGKDHPSERGKGIAGSTTGPNDSILLPTARDLGLIGADGKRVERVKP